MQGTTPLTASCRQMAHQAYLRRLYPRRSRLYCPFEPTSHIVPGCLSGRLAACQGRGEEKEADCRGSARGLGLGIEFAAQAERLGGVIWHLGRGEACPRGLIRREPNSCPRGSQAVRSAKDRDWKE